MGLMGRWLVVSAVAVGLVAVAMFTGAAPEPTEPARDRLLARDVRLGQVARLWSAHVQRDSVVALVARSSGTAESLTVTFAGFAQADSTQEAEAMLRRRWRTIPQPDPAVRVAVAVFHPAMFREAGVRVSPYSGAAIVVSDSLVFCTAIIGATVSARAQVKLYESTLDETLGPCLLLGAFGKPGAGMAQWLRATRYASARSNAWLDRPREFIDGHRQPPWAAQYDRSWEAALYQRGAGGLIISWMLAPPYYLGAPAMYCLNGDPASCVRGVMGPVRMISGMPDDLTTSWGLSDETPGLFDSHRLADWFLSDLIRAEGRDRFAQFWKSDAPIEVGFREAFGRELGDWTHWWARRQWQESWIRIETGQGLTLGTNLRASWFGGVLAWATLAVLIAASTARRRQVTYK